MCHACTKHNGLGVNIYACVNMYIKMDSIWRMSKLYFMPLKFRIYFISNMFVLKTIFLKHRKVL